MQFVHGGCTLQEVIIPIIEVKKRRISDTTQVEVNLIPSSSAVISMGQLAIALYQAEAVTDKVQPRCVVDRGSGIPAYGREPDSLDARVTQADSTGPF